MKNVIYGLVLELGMAVWSTATKQPDVVKTQPLIRANGAVTRVLHLTVISVPVHSVVIKV